MISLREYQQKIINIIKEKIKQDKKEIFIQIPTGTGKSTIIKYFIDKIESKKNILIITNNKTTNLQYRILLKDNANVTVIVGDFRNLSSIIKFDYIIFTNIEMIKEEKFNTIKEKFLNTKIIAFFNVNTNKNSWLNKKNIDYSLNLQEVLNEGYINPNYIGSDFNQLIYKFLEYQRLTNIKQEVALKINKLNKIRIDFIAEKEEQKLLIESKFYRSKFISNNILENIIEQLKYYKDKWKAINREDLIAVLIISCKIPEEIKEKTYKEGIIILDISNLLYLLQENSKLTEKLEKIIQYNFSDITPIELKDKTIFVNQNNVITHSDDKAMIFIKKLENLKYGKKDNNDKKYQRIVSDILYYLFDKEFSITAEQYETEDKMFIMDLICGIKGNSELWKLLIQHYNSRFIVFEFKNYKDELSQNNIYITSKYLYNAALRNVAIIISRKGFSKNAVKSAKGILIEEEKLIIDVKDEDLINMIRMKMDGQEASDYLLEKLEKYLISISK